MQPQDPEPEVDLRNRCGLHGRVPDDGAPTMPEYLRDRSGHIELPSSAPQQPTPRSRMSIARTIAIALASAALASSVTVAIAHRSGRTTPSSGASSTTASTAGSNPVVRVDEPVTIDGWVMVVTRYKVLHALKGYPPSPDRRWLVVDARLTNTMGTTRDFTPEMIEARTLNFTGVAEYTSAMPGTVWQPSPHSTISGQFIFSVSALAQTFTIVIRREIVRGKGRGDSVEIDLNCC
jgi:hypothetical protein